jgi:hypothetical protein
MANVLSISVYEWPLPEDDHKAMATVFEVRAPKAFRRWRDATYYLITTVLSMCDDTAKQPFHAFGLDKHQELTHKLSERYHDRRVIIVSTTTSLTTNKDSKETLKAIPLVEDSQVCVTNRSEYRYYDKTESVCIGSDWKFTQELPLSCSYALPQEAKDLNCYSRRLPAAPDGPTSNSVIANQDQCPAHFSTDEFKAFCTIPFGCEIMYENILVQLAMPAVDFGKVETQYLMQQIIHQTGPMNGQVERILHWILQDAQFCDSMLGQLESARNHISENWESWRALATFSLLTRRILSMTPSEEIRFLVSVREVCLRWLRTLADRVKTSTGQEQRSELYARTLDIALLGTSTFDVDDAFFDNILNQPGATSTLLQFSIRVQENQEFSQSNTEDMCKIMHQSWQRLMYRILPMLRRRLARSYDELSQAVLVTWSTFQTASEARWFPEPAPQHRWLRTTSGTSTVHVDLLTGTLLINGQPLTRLPNQITGTDMYAHLFGKTILEVGPSDEAGMQFCTKAEHHGHKLHFGRRQSDLLVLAVKHRTR